jgi:hypothetical protein
MSHNAPYSARRPAYRRLLRPTPARVHVSAGVKIHRRPSGRSWRISKVWCKTLHGNSVPHRVSRYAGDWYIEVTPNKPAVLKYPTLAQVLEDIREHSYTCAGCGSEFVDTEDIFPRPMLCQSCEIRRGNV